MHVSLASPASATPPVSPSAPQPPAPPRAPHIHDDSLAPFPPASSTGTRPHHRAPRARSHPGAPDTARSVWSAWSAWSEGRGPDPAPRFLVRWHLSDGTPCHEPAASDAEALAFARDAGDAAQTEAAVYRLWSILPD